MKILPILEEIISESIGRIKWIDEVSNLLKNVILQNLQTDGFRIQPRINKLINYVTIDIENINKENFITGKINPNDFVEYNNLGEETYDITVKIFIGNNVEDLENRILSILNHELKHFYDWYIKKEKTQVTKDFTKFKNKLSIDYGFNPIIKEFLNIFYLTIDEEISARQQEFSSQVKGLNKEERLEKLKQSKLYKDSIRIINYDINVLDNLEENLKEELFEKTNKFLTVSYNKEGNFFNNFSDFKKYFNKRFKEKGLKLHKKLMLIAGSINENQLKDFIVDEGFFTEIEEIILENRELYF